MFRYALNLLIATVICVGPVLAAMLPPWKDRRFLFPDEQLD